MDARVEKAARHNDVYELVRLSHDHADWADDIDEALVEVARGLTARERSHELAHILTLPGKTPEWAAADLAMEALAQMGPKAAQAVLSASLSAAGPTKTRAAQALERMGEHDKAAAIRATLRATDDMSGATAQAFPSGPPPLDRRWLTVAAPSQTRRPLGLTPQRDELTRLGFEILSESDLQIVAVRQKWYWDVLGTKLTQVVFVWSVATLSGTELGTDLGRLRDYAATLDPSRLPRGLQKGLAVIPVYLADTIEADAQQSLQSKPSVGFAVMCFPAARDMSTGASFIPHGTAMVGRAYMPKLRFVARRLVDPEHAPGREPVSALMIVLGLIILAAIALIIVSLVVG